MGKEVLRSISLLMGCIIGAGILGLPYVFAKAGFITGLIVLIAIGLAVLILNLYVGEIVLRTKDLHELTGYAEKYLGKWARNLITFSFIVGIGGALIAYLIGEGAALSAIFGGNPLIYSLIFFCIMAVLIFFGLNWVAGSELLLTTAMFFLIFLIFIFTVPFVNVTNLSHFDISKVFIPYGVVLFALVGSAAIPEVKAELKKNKKLLKKTIILGSLIPLILYILFAAVAVGVTGLSTTEVSTIGLGNALGKHIILLGNLFAIFAMATSFLVLGLALQWVLHLDYRINKHLAWFLTCFIPLAIALSGATTFIQAMAISGAIAGGLEGILIVLMFKKAKKLGKRKPEYEIKDNNLINFILILIFILGIAYTLWSLI